MKLSSLKTDSKRAEQGVWVGDIPEMGDVKLLVRGWNNLAFRAQQQKLIRALPRGLRSGMQLLPKVQDQISAKCMRDTILLDWRNIQADDGSPIHYDRELAGKLLEDPDSRAFFDAVMWASMNIADGQAEEEEGLEKNSSPPSATT